MESFAILTLLAAVEPLQENATSGYGTRIRLVRICSFKPSSVVVWTANTPLGMQLHLFTILPATLLACLQFIPVIRHKVLLFHRLNGYVAIVLTQISSAGVLMIARHAFGGDFATQTWAGATVILTTLGLLMAYINIKLLQIDQHRAWMMRAWVWFGTIITIRIIMIISAQIISITDGW